MPSQSHSRPSRPILMRCIATFCQRPSSITHHTAAGSRLWTAKDACDGCTRNGRARNGKGWYLLVLVAQHTAAEYLAYLQRESIPYLVAGDERVDLPLALERLRSKLGVACLLSTGGGKLNGALLRAGLVDEVSIEFFPAVIGGSSTPTLFDSAPLQADEWPTRLKLISAQVQAEGRVWLRYQVVSE